MVAPAFGLVGGRVFDGLISNVDILPTILQVLGLPLPGTLSLTEAAKLLPGIQVRHPVEGRRTSVAFIRPGPITAEELEQVLVGLVGN